MMSDFFGHFSPPPPSPPNVRFLPFNVRYFGIILDHPSPPKIGHHLWMFPYSVDRHISFFISHSFFFCKACLLCTYTGNLNSFKRKRCKITQHIYLSLFSYSVALFSSNVYFASCTVFISGFFYSFWSF